MELELKEEICRNILMKHAKKAMGLGAKDKVGMIWVMQGETIEKAKIHLIENDEDPRQMKIGEDE